MLKGRKKEVPPFLTDQEDSRRQEISAKSPLSDRSLTSFVMGSPEDYGLEAREEIMGLQRELMNERRRRQEMEDMNMRLESEFSKRLESFLQQYEELALTRINDIVKEYDMKQVQWHTRESELLKQLDSISGTSRTLVNADAKESVVYNVSDVERNLADLLANLKSSGNELEHKLVSLRRSVAEISEKSCDKVVVNELLVHEKKIMNRVEELFVLLQGNKLSVNGMEVFPGIEEADDNIDEDFSTNDVDELKKKLRVLIYMRRKWEKERHMLESRAIDAEERQKFVEEERKVLEERVTEVETEMKERVEVYELTIDRMVDELSDDFEEMLSQHDEDEEE